MIVTIHQPDFLPWLGFFDRWDKSDMYIVLDDVQFLRQGWHHRDKIKTKNGVKWLTIPVFKKGRYYQNINKVEVNNQESWRQKHLNTIYAAYNGAPNFDYVYPVLRDIYAKEYMRLIDLNMDLLKWCANVFGITTPIKLASTFAIKEKGTKKLIELVNVVKGDVYLTGLGSKEYLEVELFRKAGIEVLWQKFKHPDCAQLQGDLKGALSALDFLMMHKTVGSITGKTNGGV